MFDEYSGWETNPDTIIFNLRGLPAFPKSDEQPDTKSVDAAFSTTTGPASFILEVIMLPAKDPQAPDEIFMLLEEARICQNSGQYDVALTKLHAARLLWEDKSAWAIVKAGLDPVTVRARAERARERIEREAARDQEIERQWRERDRRERAEDESRRAALEAEARLMGNISFLLERSDNASEEMRTREAERAREREQYAREKAQRELRERSREGIEEADALRYCAIEAQTTPATETEFYVYLFLHAGSVYASAGDAASALAMNWRAYTVYKRYIALARAQPAVIHQPQPASYFASSLAAPLTVATDAVPSTLQARLGLGDDTLRGTHSFPPASAAASVGGDDAPVQNKSGKGTSRSPYAGMRAASEAAAAQGLLITLDDVADTAEPTLPLTTAGASLPMVHTWAATVARAQSSAPRGGSLYAYPLSAPAFAEEAGVDATMRWAARQGFAHMRLEDIDPLDGACPLLATVLSCMAADCHSLGHTDLALSCLSAVRSLRFLCLPETSPEFADVGSCLNNIGACLFKLGRYREARVYFHAALDVLLALLEPLHPRVCIARANLERTLPHAPRAHVDLSQLEVTPVSPTATTVTVRPPYTGQQPARPLIATTYQQMLLAAAAPKKPAPAVDDKKKK